LEWIYKNKTAIFIVFYEKTVKTAIRKILYLVRAQGQTTIYSNPVSLSSAEKPLESLVLFYNQLIKKPILPLLEIKNYCKNL